MISRKPPLVALLGICLVVLVSLPESACSPRKEPASAPVEESPAVAAVPQAVFPPTLPDQTSTVRFERISAEDGLSQNAVLAILQDRRGFMWFGTEGGLNKYDGRGFTVYKHDADDPSTLSDDYVSTILEDRDGELWVGTRNGLNRYVRATGTFARYEHDPSDPLSLGGKWVVTVYEDREGVLWVGTDDGGVDRLDSATDTFAHHRHDPDDPTTLSDDSVGEIYEDRSGELWVGTDGGLNRFDRTAGTFTRYQNDPNHLQSLSHDEVSAILEDRQGVLWIGTEGGGLEQFDRSSQTFVHHRHDPDDPGSLSHDRVRAIFEDGLGRLWVGTQNGLDLLDRDRNQFVHYRHNPNDLHSLSSNSIWSIYEDRTGVLWFGTYGGGLSKYNRTTDQFTLYQHNPDLPNSLSDNMVWSLFQDSSGKLWIGTFNGGLNRLDRESDTFTVFRHVPEDPASLSSDDVRAVLEDQGGTLWVGTGNGLDQFDPATETFIHYRHDPDAPDSLSENRVTVIYEDRSGNLWIGTRTGGLNRFDRATKTFVRYQHSPDDPFSLSDDRVWALYEDRSGALWVGTLGGINVLDPATGRFTHYVHDPDDPGSLGNDQAFSFYEDPAGAVWIGTWGSGLDRFDRATQTFTHYTEKDGLPDNVIYGIEVDSEGCLWLSTNKGLSKFDPRTESFQDYDITHGLQNNEFNVGAHFRSEIGEMFFGGIQGFNAFFPERVTGNPHVPPIVITAFSKFNEVIRTDLPPDEHIQLSYKDNFIAFEFAALDFSAPEKNQYAYRLEGFDEDWVDAGMRRYASYTNLRGGDYVFRVKGSNNDGIWNEEGVAIRITVTPPLWETWWFRGIALLALVGGAIGAYWLRVRSVEARSRDLEVQVKDRTVEIERRTQELEALNAIAAVVSRSLDLQEILSDALDKTLEVTGLEAGGIYLLREDVGILTVAAHRGLSAQFVAEIDNLAVGEGLSGRVVQTGEPLVVSDLTTDSRLARSVVREEGFHAAAVFPLASRGKELGTLFVITRGRREFSQQDIELFTSIGHQIGVAIDNARLFEAAQRRAEQFWVISEVGHRITSILAVDELLEQIVTLLKEALNYSVVGIGLIEGDELVFRAGAAAFADGSQLDQPLRFKVGQEGISGWVAQSGEPLLVPDVSQEPRYYHLPEARETRSELAVPLKVKKATIGVLDVESDHLNAFDESDLVMLQSLAHQAAIAIENARLFEEAQFRAKELAVLNELGQALTAQLNVEQVLDEAYRGASRLVDATNMYIALYNPADDEVTLALHVVEGDIRKPYSTFPASQSLAGHIIRSRTPMLIKENVSERVKEIGLEGIWLRPGQISASWLGVPLLVSERVLGVMAVQNYTTPRVYDEHDRDLLTAIASQTAIALQNAQLFAEVEQRMQELEALYRADEELYRHLKLDQVLQTLVEVAVDILRADKSSLMVWDPRQERLVVQASRGFRPETLAQMTFALGEGTVGLVGVTGEPAIVEDTQTDPRVAKRITEPEGIRSFMHVPIRIEGQVFGVFNVDYTRPRAFGEEEQRLFTALAQRAALAIENAQLYEQAQELAVVEERQRLARDLHDAVTQTLFSASLIAEVLPLLWERNPDEGYRRLEELRELTRGALAEMRTLLLELRPSALIEANLMDLLRQLAESITGRARVPVAIEVEGECELVPEVKVALYRIAQEALNNVAKHAGASQATVNLRCGSQRVRLSVNDDGCGFDVDSIPPDHLGVGIMRERAEAIGAQLEIESRVGQGTQVMVVWGDASAETEIE